MISTKLVKLNDLTRRVADFLGKKFGGFFFGPKPQSFLSQKFPAVKGWINFPLLWFVDKAAKFFLNCVLNNQ